MTIDAGVTHVVGVRAAARALGLNASTVSRYLKDHPELNHGTAARPMVNLEELRRHRVENLNAARCGSHAGLLLGQSDELDGANGRAQPTTGQAGGPPTYADSKAAREAVLAIKAQLDLDEKLGTLLVRAEVEEAIAAAGQLLQRELLDLAPRLAEEIAVLGEPREIQERMEFQFRALLKRYAGELAGWE